MKQTLRERLTQELQILITRKKQLEAYLKEYLVEENYESAASVKVKIETFSLIIGRLQDVLKEH
jgi:protein-arginine kinase activator protein McsA